MAATPNIVNKTSADDVHEVLQKVFPESVLNNKHATNEEDIPHWVAMRSGIKPKASALSHDEVYPNLFLGD